MSQTPVEADAVRSARDGDAGAFEFLVRQHQEAVFRVAFQVLRDAAAAQDIAQETFLRAHKHISRYREGEPLRPWLLKIALNLALNEARARRRRTGLAGRLGLLPPPVAPPVDLALVATEEARVVYRALDRLPEQERLVLVMRYFMELTEKEMASVLSRPRGTVKSRLHRALERLRTVIEREFPELRQE